MPCIHSFYIHYCLRHSLFPMYLRYYHAPNNHNHPVLLYMPLHTSCQLSLVDRQKHLVFHPLQFRHLPDIYQLGPNIIHNLSHRCIHPAYMNQSQQYIRVNRMSSCFVPTADVPVAKLWLHLSHFASFPHLHHSKNVHTIHTVYQFPNRMHLL